MLTPAPAAKSQVGSLYVVARQTFKPPSPIQTKRAADCRIGPRAAVRSADLRSNPAVVMAISEFAAEPQSPSMPRCFGRAAGGHF
jgi:hypothetical protein